MRNRYLLALGGALLAVTALTASASAMDPAREARISAHLAREVVAPAADDSFGCHFAIQNIGDFALPRFERTLRQAMHIEASPIHPLKAVTAAPLGGAAGQRVKSAARNI